MAFNAGQSFERLDLCQEFLPHFVSDICAKLEQDYRSVNGVYGLCFWSEHTDMNEGHYGD
jgi:hypothetical protein